MSVGVGMAPALRVGTGSRMGDDRALEQTLTELVPAVRRWTYRILGPGPELDDAVQEALIELASALERYEGRAAVTTFAYPVVIRTVYRHLRRHPACARSPISAPVKYAARDPVRSLRSLS